MLLSVYNNVVYAQRIHRIIILVLHARNVNCFFRRTLVYLEFRVLKSFERKTFNYYENMARGER